MIEVKELKYPQHNLASDKYLEPKILHLPLSQHTGSPSTPFIKKGDRVNEADLIAKMSGFISVPLHAPSTGKVLNIDSWFHPNLKRATAITIKTENKQKEYTARKNPDELKKEELIKIIKESGIVGMGGAAFPTHVKLVPPKTIETVIINGCECEPYLAADQRLMLENSNEIFRGIEIICKLIEPKKVIFAIEDNKPEAIKKVNLLIHTKKFNLPDAKTEVLKSAYPQGGEKQLINSVTGKKVPGGKLPLDVGCLVHNVATCFAIYEAVYFAKPLIERLVSFCGDALVSPKNVWVKIGTSLRELFDNNILAFKKEPEMIISGGPMMGISLDSLDYPVLKGTGGFLFLGKKNEDLTETTCIKCARCIDACPMNLMPLEYAKRVKRGDYASLSAYNISDCIECGSCAYSCPAKIPLVHYVKIGKKYAPKNK